ncbi:MAG: DNA-directed RNA polymerase subunit omega [Cellulosilyticaceae bacterium]
MLQPSYSQLMKKLNSDASETVVTSRYSIVIATAKRARQIIDIVNEDAMAKSEKNNDIQIDPSRIKEAAELSVKLRHQKPTSIAVDELYSGKVTMRERIIEG